MSDVISSVSSNVRSLKLERLIGLALLAYLTVHLLEEGIFGFPAWAELRWRIPNYTTGKWLLHNVYFAFFLILGYLLYRKDTTRFLPLGVGILVWGFMNALNHVIFTLIFLEYSPGLVTGLIWVPLGVWGVQRLHHEGRLTPKNMILSILAGLLYWGIPITLFIIVDSMLGI